MESAMKVVPSYVWPFLVLLLASCSTISVNTDFDPKADFAALTTFDVGNTTNQNDELVQNPLLQQRVNRSLVNQMEARGFTYTKENPDMLLYPHASSEEKISVTDWGSSYGGWWGSGPYGWGHSGRIDVRQYTQGYLIVDIVTAPDKQLVWRGVGSFTVSSRELTPEESQERVDDIVAQILERYPPQ